jgi:hypothetical protein
VGAGGAGDEHATAKPVAATARTRMATFGAAVDASRDMTVRGEMSTR